MRYWAAEFGGLSALRLPHSLINRSIYQWLNCRSTFLNWHRFPNLIGPNSAKRKPNISSAKLLEKRCIPSKSNSIGRLFCCPSDFRFWYAPVFASATRKIETIRFRLLLRSARCGSYFPSRDARDLYPLESSSARLFRKPACFLRQRQTLPSVETPRTNSILTWRPHLVVGPGRKVRPRCTAAGPNRSRKVAIAASRIFSRPLSGANMSSSSAPSAGASSVAAIPSRR